ncbi:MAG: IS4 family transposase, partial [Okeania sp. SIO2H7]|nr:IS4 family transposase [Okeania sp. SIO2H7]
MSNWAIEELKYADLGDRRRKERLIKIVSDLAAQPNASVPQASGDWAGTQGAYDFWSNKRVKAEDIRLAHQKSTIERVKQHETIVAIQDTSELNFTNHSSKKGMGHLDNKNSRGVKMHSVFCVSPLGVPLGVLHQKVWARELSNIGKKHTRKKREIKDKESKRWLEGLSITQEVIPADVKVVTVADCEADIYDFLAMPRPANSELLIRAYQNRCVKTDISVEKLQVAIDSSERVGEITLELQRTPERKARQVTLSLRTMSVELQPPKAHINYSYLKPIRVAVIKAEEENPPVGEKPVTWLLLTTIKINDFNGIVQCLRWYSYRWLIERYHYTLKSGCRLEQLQLKSADR